MSRSIGIAVAGGVWLAGVMAASAADLGAPAAPVAPGPLPFNWSGFYIGGNIGGAWGHNDFANVANADLFPPFLAITGVVPDRFTTLPGIATNGNGFLGGGQIGLNWQFDELIVFGIEGDVQATSLKTAGNVTAVDPTGTGASFSATYAMNMEWVATVRARVGVTWDRLMVYATGGAAFGGSQLTTLLTRVDPPASLFNLPGPTGITSSTGAETGWTAGAGVEWAFTPYLSLGVQYLHIDLGSQTLAIGTTSTLNAAATTILSVPLSVPVKTTMDQASVRLNWRWAQ